MTNIVNGFRRIAEEGYRFAGDAAAEANDRAEGLGIYFNGVEADYDCACCGDRAALEESK